MLSHILVRLSADDDNSRVSGVGVATSARESVSLGLGICNGGAGLADGADLISFASSLSGSLNHCRSEAAAASGRIANASICLRGEAVDGVVYSLVGDWA